MRRKHAVLVILMVTLALALCSCQQARRDTEHNYKPYHTNDGNNNLAKGAVMTEPYVVDGKRYTPMSVQEAWKYRERGEAAWYGDEIYMAEGGNYNTANGEVFDENLMTAGHKYLPLPTYVKVTNLNNNKSVIVRVNDRGPFHPDRLIVLSKAAAEKLGFEHRGTAPVMVETVQVGGSSYTGR